jgi:hypothetical protein
LRTWRAHGWFCSSYFLRIHCFLTDHSLFYFASLSILLCFNKKLLYFIMFLTFWPVLIVQISRVHCDISVHIYIVHW